MFSGICCWPERFIETPGRWLTDSRFLALVGGLGVMLTGVYRVTGSLWLIAFIHWIVVLVVDLRPGRQRQTTQADLLA